MKRIYSYSVLSTDTGVNSLNSILTNALSFTSDDFLEIELKDAGTYNLERRFGLSCNLKIKGFVGANGGKSTLFFTSNAISATNMGDGFLSVRGVSGRIEASVENLNIGLASGIVPSASLLLRFWNCYKIRVFNVDSSLNNGQITNIDIRVSDNITVEGCNIVNENGHKNSSGVIDNTAGGCLWIRGGCRNVRIFGNSIYKNGNDEAVGIWGGKDSDYTLDDISITDNVMEYGTLGSYNYPIDVLIAFNSDIEATTPRRHYWRNFLFARNVIKCNSPVKRVIWITQQTCDDIENFTIANNSFYHTGYSSTDSSGYVEDIEVRRIPKTSLSDGKYEGVRIMDNEFVAKESIVNANGHRNIISNFSKLVISGNYMDSTTQKLTSGGKTTYGSTFISLSGQSEDIYLSHNRIIGDVRFIQSFSSSLISVTLNCVGNYIYGSSEIYLRHTVTEAKIIVKGNTVENGTCYPFLQESARGGSIILSDNVFVRNTTASGGTIFEQYGTTANPSYSMVLITGNSFVGYGSNVLNNASKLGSNPYVQGNNIF